MFTDKSTTCELTATVLAVIPKGSAFDVIRFYLCSSVDKKPLTLFAFIRVQTGYSSGQ
jgi:hypothetical protein